MSLFYDWAKGQMSDEPSYPLEVAKADKINPVPPRDPDTAAKLSAISQAYIKDREIKDAREAIGSPIWDLIRRNAVYAASPIPRSALSDALVYGSEVTRTKGGVSERVPPYAVSVASQDQDAANHAIKLYPSANPVLIGYDPASPAGDKSCLAVGVPEVKVTQEMRRVGGDCLKRCREMEVFNEQAADVIFRAMHALAPVEFCPEDRIASLSLSLDNANSHARTLEDSLNRSQTELTDALAEAHELRAERDRWIEHTKFVMRDRIALRSKLAAFTTANVAPKTEAKPVHDFTRASSGDPRLMGTPQRLT